jgi:peroxiredoxin
MINKSPKLKTPFLLLVLLLLCAPASATVIKGQNEAYAGRELIFFRYSDAITREKISAFSIKIDTDGKFSKEIEASNTDFFFTEFGIYRGLLFPEAGKEITLRLPPLREKSFADQKNPFFKPVEFWFATEQGNRLNDKISAFDQKLNQLTDQYFNRLYFRQSEQIFDTLKTELNRQFGSAKAPTFLMHKNLSLKSVETDAFRLGPREISAELSDVDPLFWTHPAFIDLFEKTYANKLSFEAKTTGNDEIFRAVASANTGFLTEYLKKNYQLSSPMLELALLKMLHDSYYSGDFSQESIIKITGSDYFQKNRHEQISTTAQNVLQKIKFLRPGSTAPVICLKDTDGRNRCTNENSGKFKYFIFADTEMVVCKEHLKYLTKIEERFNKHLEIYVILRKTDLIEMKIFLDENEIPGIHLVDSNGEFIEQYRIKSYPTCFLLNENHNVVFQQAKAPLDGFEQQFGAFLQKELFERQRNQER